MTTMVATAIDIATLTRAAICDTDVTTIMDEHTATAATTTIVAAVALFPPMAIGAAATTATTIAAATATTPRATATTHVDMRFCLFCVFQPAS